MNNSTNKIITAVLIIGAIFLMGYAGYRIYNWAIEDATKRIKQGVAEGVGEGIGGAINPLKTVGKILGK